MIKYQKKFQVKFLAKLKIENNKKKYFQKKFIFYGIKYKIDIIN